MSALIVTAIVVITLALVISPLVEMIPSARQKKQQGTRQEAIKQGIQVQIRHPKIVDALATTYPELALSVAYFLSTRESKLTDTFCAIKSKHYPGRWFWINNHQPDCDILNQVNPCLQSLPDYINAIEIGPAGAALFWQESSAVERVTTIKSQLEALCYIIENLK